jgi:hypothetical protein
MNFGDPCRAGEADFKASAMRKRRWNVRVGVAAE